MRRRIAKRLRPRFVRNSWRSLTLGASISCAKLLIALNVASWRSSVAKRKQHLTQANYNAIRDHLFDRIHTTGEQVKNDFPNILRAAIETEAWKHFTNGDGKPFV